LTEAPASDLTPAPPGFDRESISVREKHLSVLAVLLVFLLSALDQTVVATALPRIVRDLHGFTLYAWVTTAYMLSSTVAVPIVGKLNDLYGRKPVLIASICVFLGGSALCGMAGEFGSLFGGGMMQLVVFRAVQGLGGAGLFTCAHTIIGDLYSPLQRARIVGWFGSAYGLASIVGPLIGGFLADRGTLSTAWVTISGWRLIFYVNLPIGALSLLMISTRLPRLPGRMPGRIDWAGALLTVSTVVPFLLALSWGGRLVPWHSSLIVSLLAISTVSLAALIRVETTVADPLIVLSLFRNRVFLTVNAAGLFTAMAFMGLISFLPFYIQFGQGVSATASGVALLAMTVGMLGSNMVSGYLVSALGRYKPVMIVGATVMAGGTFFVSRVGADTSLADLSWRLFLVGFGMGPCMTIYNLVVQNALPRQQLGVATSSTQFFRQIGSTIGVALLGAILLNALTPSPGSRDPASPAQHRVLEALTSGAVGAGRDGGRAPEQEKAPVRLDRQSRQIVSRAIVPAFEAAFLLALLALLIVVAVPQRPLDRD
jgi:EmrB/QacA subfamily drug resistance transporter